MLVEEFGQLVEGGVYEAFIVLRAFVAFCDGFEIGSAEVV